MLVNAEWNVNGDDVDEGRMEVVRSKGRIEMMWTKKVRGDAEEYRKD